MSENPIVVSKSDLREIVAEFTSNDRSMQSKFWGNVQESLKLHTELLDEHTHTISDIQMNIALMKQSQVRQEESQAKILEQVLKTNGRVTGHDKDLDTTKGWVKGVGLMIFIVVSLAVTIFELRLAAIAKTEEGTQKMLEAHLSK